MRFNQVFIAALACLAASASATEGKNDTSKGGGHGATSPTPSEQSADTTTTEAGPTETAEKNLGTGYALSKDRFKFDLGWETHAMLVSNNFAGDGTVGTGGAEIYYNYFYAGVSYYLGKNDKLALVQGFYLFHLYNQGGPDGFFMDDMLLRYSHHFALPWKLGLAVAGSLTAPFSNLSYQMGLITEPQLRIAVNRTFAKYVTVDMRIYGDWYWQRYTSMIGGSTPNPYARFGGRLNVEAELPWHPALSLGVDAETGYTGFYNPAVGPTLGQPGMPTSTTPGPTYGVEGNPIYTAQPWQQDYGLDVYVKYDFPKFYGVKAEAVLAYAQGDPTTGYSNDLVDGVSNLYLYYPEASQVYLSLDLTY